MDKRGNAPKKAKTTQLKMWYILPSIFWDFHVVLVDYLKKGKIIGEYYVALLVQLNDTIKVKRFHLAKSVFPLW